MRHRCPASRLAWASLLVEYYLLLIPTFNLDHDISAPVFIAVLQCVRPESVGILRGETHTSTGPESVRRLVNPEMKMLLVQVTTVLAYCL